MSEFATAGGVKHGRAVNMSLETYSHSRCGPSLGRARVWRRAAHGFSVEEGSVDSGLRVIVRVVGQGLVGGAQSMPQTESAMTLWWRFG